MYIFAYNCSQTTLSNSYFHSTYSLLCAVSSLWVMPGEMCVCYRRYYAILFKGLGTCRLWNPLGKASRSQSHVDTERHLLSKQNGPYLNGYCMYLFTKYYCIELVLCEYLTKVLTCGEYLTKVCWPEFHMSF